VSNRSNLPRNVTVAEALEHEEVQARLRKGISALQETVALFLERICAAREQLPYSLLCTARTLHNALASRFPTFPEKDLLKVERRYIVFFVYDTSFILVFSQVIGNVIYYHFINAAIVAPDAYDIITLPADKTLMADQRNNLASIAKILQYAASKKGVSQFLLLKNP
jgi:GTPase-activator protein for Ras-like GTPase